MGKKAGGSGRAPQQGYGAQYGGGGLHQANPPNQPNQQLQDQAQARGGARWGGQNPNWGGQGQGQNPNWGGLAKAAPWGPPQGPPQGAPQGPPQGAPQGAPTAPPQGAPPWMQGMKDRLHGGGRPQGSSHGQGQGNSRPGNSMGYTQRQIADYLQNNHQAPTPGGGSGNSSQAQAQNQAQVRSRGNAPAPGLDK